MGTHPGVDEAEVPGESGERERSPRLAEETQSGNLKNCKFWHFLEVQQSWRKEGGEVQWRSRNEPEE